MVKITFLEWIDPKVLHNRKLSTGYSRKQYNKIYQYISQLFTNVKSEFAVVDVNVGITEVEAFRMLDYKCFDSRNVSFDERNETYKN